MMISTATISSNNTANPETATPPTPALTATDADAFLKSLCKTRKITPHQRRVYLLLLQIPPGKVATYALLSKALSSSPRAIGGALRTNPFAPTVPCHRVIASTGYIGGFKGDWRNAPSGVNIEEKLKLLEIEGVTFDSKGVIREKRQVWSKFAV